MKKFKNSFVLSEWSGSIGDLGLLLPLAFTLVVSNGFPPGRLFLLWGVVYIITGFFYRIPISVQPLKAMAIISITLEFPAEYIASTAFFYGIILLVLSLSGGIKLLQKCFSKALIRGIQLGVGAILMHKMFEFVLDKGVFLHWKESTPLINILMFLPIVGIIWLLQIKRKFPVTILLVLFGIFIPIIAGVTITRQQSSGLINFTIPDYTIFISGLIYLIIPQLPLTLGNAVISASDVSRSLWKERAEKATPTRLGFSIGLSNIFIGLLGGFPICHGASGMVAHKQFGGKTGGTTIILGSMLVVISLIPSMSTFLFIIPIPVLCAMLFFPCLKLMLFIRDLQAKIDLFVAFLVAAVAFISKNLAMAMLCGFIIERMYLIISKSTAPKLPKASDASFSDDEA